MIVVNYYNWQPLTALIKHHLTVISKLIFTEFRFIFRFHNYNNISLMFNTIIVPKYKEDSSIIDNIRFPDINIIETI